MPKCEISGKHRQVGNNVSHANNKTKRAFKVNVHKIKIVDENGVVRRAWVSTKAVKSGLVRKPMPRKVALAQAAAAK
jgi:large subunit ribosomal protein L28